MIESNVPMQLNPLLRGATHQEPILIFDLSQAVFNPHRARHVGDPEGVEMSKIELSQPATFPAVADMTIDFDEKYTGLGWKIRLIPSRNSEIGAANTSQTVFITVYDVLHGIHQALHNQIRWTDWDKLYPEPDELKERRRHIRRAYKARIEKLPHGEPTQTNGIRWVDYLLEDSMFRRLELHGQATTPGPRSARLLVGNEASAQTQ